MALGFTAINSSSPGETNQAAFGSTDQNANDQTRSVVSEYLGRGLSIPEAPLPAGTRKTAPKGKKRAAPKSDASKAKRRRPSSIKEGMQVTKATDTADNHPPPKKKKKQTTSKKSVSNADPVGVAGVVETTIPMKPVPVYAPATSMDALDSTSARTSFDSAKARPGQSFTVYQGSSSAISTRADAGLSAPWSGSSMGEVPTNSTSTTKASQRSTAKLHPVNEEPVTQDDPELPRRSTRLLKTTQKAPVNDTIDLIEQSGDENEFSDVEEDDLMDFARSVERFIGLKSTSPPPRKKSQNTREVDEHEDYGGALFSAAEKRLIGERIRLRSSFFQLTSTDDLEEQKRKRDDDSLKPILRKPFEPSILDRSPIWGASNSVLLRTCFRLGEALNTGSQAVRCNQDVVIELYARVTSSWREEKPRPKQHFVFKDLYHDKPPHLEGTYELWNQAVLWDLDSKAFLRATDEGIMCRAIAKMKREEQKWRLEILSIWESTWDDVNYVAGICTGEVAEEDD